MEVQKISVKAVSESGAYDALAYARWGSQGTGFDNAAVIDYLEATAAAKLGPCQSPAKTSASASHVQSCSHGRAEALKKPRPSCSPDRHKVSANCDKGAFQDPPSVAAGLESQGSVPQRWSPLSCTGTVILTVFLLP